MTSRLCRFIRSLFEPGLRLGSTPEIVSEHKAITNPRTTPSLEHRNNNCDCLALCASFLAQPNRRRRGQDSWDRYRRLAALSGNGSLLDKNRVHGGEQHGLIEGLAQNIIRIPGSLSSVRVGGQG